MECDCMYEEILNKFMPSKYIRDYLKNVGISLGADYIEDIIYYSPCSIDIKLKSLKEIKDLVYDDETNKIYVDEGNSKNVYCEFCHQDRIDNYTEMVNVLTEAIRLMNLDSVFTIELYRSSGEPDSYGGFIGIAGNYDNAVNLYERHVSDYDKTTYAAITCYQKNVNGKYFDVCTYYCSSRITYSVTFNSDYFPQQLSSLQEINVYVPYVPGDILESDGYPFAPKQRFVILDIGDNWDYCCVTAAYVNKKGEVKMGDVKHNMLKYRLYPQISVLYTASLFSGVLSEEERILKEISDYINKNAENGRAIYKDCVEGSPEVVRKWIKDNSK